MSHHFSKGNRQLLTYRVLRCDRQYQNTSITVVETITEKMIGGATLDDVPCGNIYSRLGLARFSRPQMEGS